MFSSSQKRRKKISSKKYPFIECSLAYMVRLLFIHHSPTYRTYPISFMFLHICRTATWTSRGIGCVGLDCFFFFHKQALCDRYRNTPSWSKIIKGIPYLNFLCIVLWCHTFIPRNAPMLPPITARKSKVNSGIRHLFFLAFSLSMP